MSMRDGIRSVLSLSEGYEYRGYMIRSSKTDPGNYTVYRNSFDRYPLVTTVSGEEAEEWIDAQIEDEFSESLSKSNPDLIYSMFEASYDEDPEETDQTYTSADTSINSSKLPAIYRLVQFNEGDVVLDYGGGRFDNGIEYLESLGCIARVYDPYNRSNEYNQETLKIIRENGGADIVLCSNVLNVIDTESARLTVLKNMKRYMSSSGTAYITVYEGSGTGTGGATKAGYQMNRKTADYISEVESVFSYVSRKGKLIIAR